MTKVKVLVLSSLAAMTFVAAPQALKAADAPCPQQNETLRGTYISLHPTGLYVGTGPGTGPATANGTITFDGRGNSSNTFSASINGAIQQGVTVVGPYVVNPDCTGTLSQSDGSHYDFVVMPDGSRFSWIETDTGSVFSGEAARFTNQNQ
ncbi:MAG: hypothetical protein JO121_18390 [Deltaproteobacteria bacterium]|nr:hypothetical protein [Deltaproteobacteria bacterium]